MWLYFEHNILVVVFVGICVVECRVVVFQNDGFSFWSVPQTISYWGHSSLPDCSCCCSTLITLVLGQVCQGAVFLVGCQLLPCALNGLVISFSGQLLAKCQRCAHLRHSCSRILRWDSSLKMLNLGRLRVASNSIGSP